MTKVLINKWDGGFSLSERPLTMENQSLSAGFNIYSDGTKLNKIDGLSVNETATGASVTAGECPVFDAVKRASDGRIIGVGHTSSANVAFKFYRKDTSITGTWQQCSASGNGIANYNAYAVLYNDVQYGYTVDTLTSEARLYRYDSDSAITLIGTTADYHASITPRPVVHSQDNILYMACNKKISIYDGTTFSTWSKTFAYTITSICEYGTYLAIACQAPEGGVIYLWGRDTSLTTLQDIIKVDNGKLQIIENLDGYLVAITETPYDPNTTSISIVSNFKTITARMYLGDKMKKISQVALGSNENGTNRLLNHKKIIRDGCLIFSTKSNYFMRFGQNQAGEYVLSGDAIAVAPGRTLVTQYGFFVLGDYLFSCHRTTTGSPSDNILYRNDASNGATSGDYTDNSYYVTTINPFMMIDDRIKDKRLTKVAIKAFSYSTSVGTITVSVSIDNGANYTTIISANAATTAFPNKYFRIEADQTNAGDPLPSGIEFLFKIETVRKIDPIEFWYEYDTTNSLIK